MGDRWLFISLSTGLYWRFDLDPQSVAKSSKASSLNVSETSRNHNWPQYCEDDPGPKKNSCFGQEPPGLRRQFPEG